MHRIMLLGEGQPQVLAGLDEALARWRAGEGLIWIDMGTAFPADFAVLQKAFGLHPLTIKAAIRPEHRARLKEYRDHFFVVLNVAGKLAPDADLSQFDTKELDIWVGHRWILTAHHEKLGVVEGVWHRVKRGEAPRPGADFILYALLDAVTAEYFPMLDRVDSLIDVAEEQIFSNKGDSDTVDELFTLKRFILSLRRTLGPQRDVLGGLVRRDFPHISADSRAYLLDVYDRTLRLFEMIDTYRELISASLDAYLSIASNRMNSVMKTLTIITTVFMPLTLITGIYGMNFAWMPGLDNPFGFAATVGAMALLAAAMFWVFRRRGWF